VVNVVDVQLQYFYFVYRLCGMLVVIVVDIQLQYFVLFTVCVGC
jgi:hypothetical protein